MVDDGNDAIERYHLAYVKLDLTTVFNAYGESPGCWPKDHRYNGWVESLGRIYEGIQHVTARIYTKHPDVLIDLSFELWGQKHLIDAGLLADGDMDWLSNVDDSQADSAGPRQARALLYQRAASMPVESMLIGNMQWSPRECVSCDRLTAGKWPSSFSDDECLLRFIRFQWNGRKLVHANEDAT